MGAPKLDKLVHIFPAQSIGDGYFLKYDLLRDRRRWTAISPSSGRIGDYEFAWMALEAMQKEKESSE